MRHYCWTHNMELIDNKDEKFKTCTCYDEEEKSLIAIADKKTHITNGRKIKFVYYDVNPDIGNYRFDDVSITSNKTAPEFLRCPEDVVRSDAKELCQYIGLKDRKGEEIYEGDIVNVEICFGATLPYFINAEIKYNEEWAAYVFKIGDSQIAISDIVQGNGYLNMEKLGSVYLGEIT